MVRLAALVVPKSKPILAEAGITYEQAAGPLRLPPTVAQKFLRSLLAAGSLRQRCFQHASDDARHESRRAGRQAARAIRIRAGRAGPSTAPAPTCGDPFYAGLGWVRTSSRFSSALAPHELLGGAIVAQGLLVGASSSRSASRSAFCQGRRSMPQIRARTHAEPNRQIPSCPDIDWLRRPLDQPKVSHQVSEPERTVALDSVGQGRRVVNFGHAC